MEQRGQFTFYRSYYEALKDLPKKDRAAVYEAICAYALDGVEINLVGIQKSVFTLVKPTLDSGRKKAKGGKNGKPNAKDNEKIIERCDEDTEKIKERCEKDVAKEKEGEKEKEREKEYECTPPPPSIAPLSTFTSFWEAYPTNRGGRELAYAVWNSLKLDIDTVDDIMDALEIFKQSKAWTEKDGKFIPSASKFLEERQWEKPPILSEIPKGATGQLGKAELEAIQRALRER